MCVCIVSWTVGCVDRTNESSKSQPSATHAHDQQQQAIS